MKNFTRKTNTTVFAWHVHNGIKWRKKMGRHFFSPLYVWRLCRILDYCIFRNDKFIWQSWHTRHSWYSKCSISVNWLQNPSYLIFLFFKCGDIPHEDDIMLFWGLLQFLEIIYLYDKSITVIMCDKHNWRRKTYTVKAIPMYKFQLLISKLLS